MSVLRRLLARTTHRLASLPLLALHVHTSCNCRCVMCDIWQANADRREIGAADLERHMAAIRALRVRRVMLTGGEPLLHRNLWALCDRLRDEGIAITLVTTGLLIDQHAREVARVVDQLVVSIDGPPAVHDAIRRVRGGFDRIARGLAAVRGELSCPHVIARCVVQRANHRALAATIEAVRAVAVDQVSFLAADVSSTAFNRPNGWPAERQNQIAVGAADLAALDAAIEAVERDCAPALAGGFVAGGAASLWRIADYYRALAGLGEFPPVRCNAPWVSAVLEPGDTLRPCFFHPAYAAAAGASLTDTLNSPAARTFRRQLDVNRDATCRRCVCTLSLPAWREM